MKHPESHRGHDVRYLGTTKEGEDVLKCYTCNPTWWDRIISFIKGV